MRVRFIFCGAAVAVVALTVSLAASASFPGTNGASFFRAIAPAANPELYVQNEDGTGVRRLTFNNALIACRVLARREDDRIREQPRRQPRDLRHGIRNRCDAPGHERPGVGRSAGLHGDGTQLVCKGRKRSVLVPMSI